MTFASTAIPPILSAIGVPLCFGVMAASVVAVRGSRAWLTRARRLLFQRDAVVLPMDETVLGKPLRSLRLVPHPVSARRGLRAVSVYDAQGERCFCAKATRKRLWKLSSAGSADGGGRPLAIIRMGRVSAPYIFYEASDKARVYTKITSTPARTALALPGLVRGPRALSFTGPADLGSEGEYHWQAESRYLLKRVASASSREGHGPVPRVYQRIALALQTTTDPFPVYTLYFNETEVAVSVLLATALIAMLGHWRASPRLLKKRMSRPTPS